MRYPHHIRLVTQCQQASSQDFQRDFHSRSCLIRGVYHLYPQQLPRATGRNTRYRTGYTQGIPQDSRAIQGPSFGGVSTATTGGGENSNSTASTSLPAFLQRGGYRGVFSPADLTASHTKLPRRPTQVDSRVTGWFLLLLLYFRVSFAPPPEASGRAGRLWLGSFPPSPPLLAHFTPVKGERSEWRSHAQRPLQVCDHGCGGGRCHRSPWCPALALVFALAWPHSTPSAMAATGTAARPVWGRSPPRPGMARSRRRRGREARGPV